MSGKDAFSDGPTPIRGVKRAHHNMSKTQIGSGTIMNRKASVTSQD